MLLAECAAANAQITLNTQISKVTFDDVFRVRSSDANGQAVEYASPILVVATGGLSIPKMGATSLGYEIARQFGHSIIPCRPALVPLKFSKSDARTYKDLAGVSVMVTARSGAQTFHEKMLFTHAGLSGPAILQASSYWNWQRANSVTIDLAPSLDWTRDIRENKASRDSASLRTELRKAVPKRLADTWVEKHRPKDWTNHSLASLDEGLHHWEVFPSGTEGYDKAEVTAGGVNTKELHGKTMESRINPGLYFIGEVVDVTGWLGGYNFQWAWSSAVAAGRDIAAKIK